MGPNLYKTKKDSYLHYKP